MTADRPDRSQADDLARTGTAERVLMGASRWLFAVLSLLFPPRFRRSFGKDLRLTLEDRCRSRWRAGGVPAVLRVWANTILEVMRDAPMEWLDKAPPRSPLPRSPRSASLVDSFFQDLRFARRTLGKSPCFTAVIVLTIAVGVGANSAIFSVINGILLRPLDVFRPEELVALWEYDNQQGPGRGQIVPLDIDDWRRQNDVFTGIASHTGWTATLVHGNTVEEISAAQVSSEMFDVIGVPPLLGRTLAQGEDGPSAAPVVVIGHDLWQRMFAGDPEAVGSRLDLDRTPYEIVGVMPPGFRLPVRPEAVLWAPLTVDAAEAGRGSHFLRAIARMRPGVDVSTAQAEMNLIAERLSEEYPATHGSTGVWVVPLQQDIVGDVERPLALLMGAVGLVLLIAAVNVANLLLARGSARSGELAVRAALGARGGRLVRQVLTESVVVALAGGLLGLVLASWGMRALVALAPDDIPRLDAIAIDAGVVGFTGLVTVITGLVFGVAPALRASRASMMETLRAAGGRSGDPGGAGGAGLRRALVVVQVALALVLVTGSGLLIRSLSHLIAEDTGFRTDVLTVRLRLGSSYPDVASYDRFYTALLERLSLRPGVESAAVAFQPPFGGFTWLGTLEIGGVGEAGDTPVARVIGISPDYFATLGIPILRGRSFTTADDAGAVPVAIVNRTLAELGWPGVEAVGGEARIGITLGPQPAERPRRIVGIVEDAKYGLDRDPRPQIYVPYRQYPASSMHVLLRTRGDPLAATPWLREEVRGLDPNLAVSDVATLAERIGESVSEERFYTLLMTAFAAVALLLGSVNISGMMAYSVARRYREIGVRMALGARRSDVLNMVVREALLVTAIGVSFGLIAARGLSRLLEGMLYEVGSTDLLTFGFTTVVVVVAALQATWAPARRATRIDPVDVLRSS